MTAPSKVSGSPRTLVRARDVLRARRFSGNDGVPVEVVESGPSLPGMVAALACKLTICPALGVVSHIPFVPFPFDDGSVTEVFLLWGARRVIQFHVPTGSCARAAQGGLRPRSVTRAGSGLPRAGAAHSRS